MEIDSARYIWMVANMLILLAITGLAFIVPIWIYRKVNSIEGNLKEINQKVEKLINSDKQ